MPVLNTSEPVEGSSASAATTVETAGISLQQSMLSIKGRYLAPDGRGVDYNKIRGSSEFENYRKIANSLVNIDLNSCSEIERKSFFISILVMSGR